MTALPDRGRLGVLPLPALLLLLHRTRFSGALRLSRDGGTIAVAVRDGSPVRVRPSGGGASLCATLVATGRVSAEDAARVAAQAPRHGGSEEKALLALGLITPKDLYLALRAHERELLLECFAWPEGDFELTAEAHAPTETASRAHDTPAIVHAGVSAHWSAPQVLAALGSAGHRFARRGPSFDEIFAPLRRLPGFEELRAHLDGHVTLAAAAQAAAHPGARAAALLLDQLGALAYFEEPLQSAAEEAAGRPPEPGDGPEIEIVVAGSDAARAEGVGAAAGPNARVDDARSDETAATKRRILEKHARLRELDHYTLLGIPRYADAPAIRRAYLALAKTHHPDVIARLGLDDVREAANEVFARITKAQAVLTDPEERRDYDEMLAGRGAEEAQRVASAEIFYRKAEVLLRKGSFDDALTFLRPAVELCGDEAAYRSALGWALFKKSASEPDAARDQLERAIALDAANALAHERLGTVLRALGKVAEGAAYLARARELEPRAATER